MHREQGECAVTVADTPRIPVTTEDVTYLLGQLGPLLLNASRFSEGPQPTLALAPLRRAEATIGAFLREHAS